MPGNHQRRPQSVPGISELTFAPTNNPKLTPTRSFTPQLSCTLSAQPELYPVSAQTFGHK